MKVDELIKYDIPQELIQKFKEENISTLYPPQIDIIRKGLFKERNLIVSLPTAAGKTLIATLSIVNQFKKRNHAVYIVPLVALANEKYQYYKKLFGKKYRVTISVGDLDSTDPWLSDYDLIICTTEKLDSLIRHNSRWVRDIGLIIADEIHMLNDTSRGPTLEIVLTRLKEIAPKAQIIGLSATIRNAAEMAKWLDANLVLSDFRPVKLYEGIAYNSKIEFYNRDSYELGNLELEASIIENTINLRKQALYFVATRKTAESLAENLSKVTKFTLARNEKTHLENLANEILGALEIPTKQCEKLASCVKSGIAFHHAGLLGIQKRMVEDNFRSGLIKAIVATPTLALGVNLPAFRVIVRDAKRYYPGIGAAYIPVLEYKQFIGRAGRPQYDDFGEAILIAKSEDDAQDLTDHFILGEPEDIISKLALEPVLRMHTLALIASEFCKSNESLLEFFSKTFYAFQYGDTSIIHDKLQDILDRLVEWKLIDGKNGKLTATRMGKRVSELYIDPLTAHILIEALGVAKKKKLEPFSFLQTISNTIEMRPLLSVRSKELTDVQEKLIEESESILQDIPNEWDLEFEDFFKSIKTAALFESWTNEITEDKLLTDYNIAPGELHSKLGIMDWLIYALGEVALLLGNKEILSEIRKTRIRLRYGIKGELIPLVKLKDVGRVRARRLFSSGLTSLEKLKEIPLDNLKRIVGPVVAESIKEQLEGKKKMKDEQATLKELGGVAGI